MTTILNTNKLTEIFFECDEFIRKLNDYLASHHLETELPTQTMSESEMMAIVIFYHHSGFKCFKYYYEQCIQQSLHSFFPKTYSYTRFINLVKRLNLHLFMFLSATRLAVSSTGNYIDATKLVVCHKRRIHNNKVFKGVAKRGKSSTGWFFGFKLHAVINEYGQLVVFKITSGNVADNDKNLLEKLTQHLQGFLYGDAGYITSLAGQLKEKGVELITKLRKNMKRVGLNEEQKHYLRHRGLIESVFKLLKKHCNIEHSRHRSVKNFFINVWSALIAYTFMDSFPSISKA